MNNLEFEHVFENLPPRRKQVLIRMLRGEADTTIAKSLKIKESTVRKYIEKLCQTFGLVNEGVGERRSKRSEMVTLFAQHKPDLLRERTSTLTQSDEPMAKPSSAEPGDASELTPPDFPLATVLAEIRDDIAPTVLQSLFESSNQKLKNRYAADLNKMGYKLYMDGDFRKATFYLDWAVKFDPALTSANFNLGSAYEKLDNKDAAQIYYEKASQDNNRAAHAAINNLARLQIIQGETEVAIQLLLSCLKQVDEDIVKWALHKNLGWAYLLQKNYPNAEKHLYEAINLDSQRPDTYCLLAKVQEVQGNERECMESSKKCLEEKKNTAGTAWRFPELDGWQTEARSRLKSMSKVS